MFSKRNFSGLLLALLLTPAVQATTPTFPNADPYFDFQTCSGGLYTGPGASGGVGCGQGKFRNGAIFDGNDDAVIGELYSARFPTFTVAAWVKAGASTAGTQTLVSEEGAYRLSIVDGSFQLAVNLRNGTVATLTRPIPDTWFNHVAGYFDGQSLGLFVNGQGQTAPAAAELATPFQPLMIGKLAYGSAFQGTLDEVRVWRQALSGPQIHELAAMIPRSDTGAGGNLYDADLTYISRSPRINYDASPNTPAVGSNVTWQAHIRNRGMMPLSNLRVQWYLDGKYLGATNVASIGPYAEATSSWTLPWSAADQYLSVYLDPQNVIPESSERNNYRQIRTNAVMVGFWVEQSVRDFFDANQRAFLQAHGLDADEANSWEDWAQRQIDRYNFALANARYPSNGMAGGYDRVRLDRVIVVPDNTLPINGATANDQPDRSDKTVDLMRGFEAPVNPAFYDVNNPNSAFFVEQSLMQTISFARFLVPTYALNLHQQMVAVENGVGARIYPDAPGGAPVYWTSAAGGVMSSWGSVFAEWEVAWLNQYARLRPLPGWTNYNSHAGMIQYLQLTPALPAQNHLKIVDRDGLPLEGATVYMYQSLPASLPGETYPRLVDNTPELIASVPDNGEIAIGTNPFSQPSFSGANFQYGVNFLRIVHRGQEHYTGIDLAQLQVAYFRGQQSSATHTIQVPFAYNSFDRNALLLDGAFAPLSFITQCQGATGRKQWRVRNDGSHYANLVGEGPNTGSCGSPTNGVFPLLFDTPQAFLGRLVWQCSGSERWVFRLDTPTEANLVNTYPDSACL